MTTSIVVCAGKNAGARSSSATTLRRQLSAVVIDAPDTDSLRGQLQSYRASGPLRVMLQYFMSEDRAILTDPAGWWDRVSGSIGRAAPEISRRASAKANINKDTGGGFLQFTWEAISASELESYCRVLENTL